MIEIWYVILYIGQKSEDAVIFGIVQILCCYDKKYYTSKFKEHHLHFICLRYYQNLTYVLL